MVLFTAFTVKRNNGYRSPPWREVFGDVAYFLIALENRDKPLSVTASTDGWFINGGFDSEKSELLYSQEGETHPTLLSLLRKECQRFDAFLSSEEGMLQMYRMRWRLNAENKNEITYEEPVRDSGISTPSTENKISRRSSKSVDARRPNSRQRVDIISNMGSHHRSGDGGPKLSPKGVTKPSGDQKKKSFLPPIKLSASNSNLRSTGSHSSENWDIIDTNNSLLPSFLTTNINKNMNYSSRHSSQSNGEVVGEQTEELIEDEITSTYQNTAEGTFGPYLDVITHERIKDQYYSPRTEETDRESSREASSESEEEELVQNPLANDPNAELPPEHWHISKLIKYIKGGNQTSTVISLCALYDMPLETEVCQIAIRDTGGVEVLINLLETDEVRSLLGSLKILKVISKNPELRRAISDQGGVPPMVRLLSSSNRDLRCLSAEGIANVAKFARARRTVRLHGGIKKLIALLDMSHYRGDLRSPGAESELEVARCGALALWSCSKSARSRVAMKKAGVISLLARLLKSRYEALLIPVVGILEECASEQDYRVAIRTEGMIEDLVAHLKIPNEELQMHCAATIFKCADDKEFRELIRKYGGLQPLIEILSHHENKELLAAATGAIWKCAASPGNAKELQKGDVISKLVSILTEQPEEMKTLHFVKSVSPRVNLVSRTEKVLVNVVGALGEMAMDKANISLIQKAGGIQLLIALLIGTNEDLLVNTTRALGQIAEDKDSASVIEKNDGVRLLWSLLKMKNSSVQANAARALCSCIENSNNDDSLRRPLAEAVARCCCWATNRIDFGKYGVVEPMVCYLKSEDPVVQCAAAKALYQLSRHPGNCVTMHAAGAVKYLVDLVDSDESGELVRSFVGGLELVISLLRSPSIEVRAAICGVISKIAKDEENLAVITDHGVVPLLSELAYTNQELQEAASSCVANIRRIALAYVKAQQEHRENPAITRLKPKLSSSKQSSTTTVDSTPKPLEDSP
nr:armadillo repeat containing protein 4 [Hymenolepis microstoma]